MEAPSIPPPPQSAGKPTRRIGVWSAALEGSIAELNTEEPEDEEACLIGTHRI